VHESLLTAWPRLVRWRTEDEGSSQLRDQLRQAAHLWEEKGRPEDLLWTGTSYQEYQVWRARFPGRLSEVEQAFGHAMFVKAGRRRRRRRLAYAAVTALLVAGLAVVGTSLRRTRIALTRTDASKLVALGRAVGVEADPTEVLAYAIASLERADSNEGRMLALDAMAHGPVSLVAHVAGTKIVAFSPDGRWLAATEWGTGETWVLGRDGSKVQFKAGRDGDLDGLAFAPGCDVIVTMEMFGEGEKDLRGRAWSLPEGRLLGEIVWRWPAVFQVLRDPPRIAVLRLADGRAELRSLRVDRPAAPTLASFDLHTPFAGWPTIEIRAGGAHRTDPALPAIDPAGRWIAVSAGRRILLQPTGGGMPPRVLASGEAHLTASPDGTAIAARDALGTTRLLSVATGAQLATFRAGAVDQRTKFSDDGRTLLIKTAAREAGATQAPGAGALLAWRLPAASPEPARTIELPTGSRVPETDRTGAWIAAANWMQPALVWNFHWPAQARPLVLSDGRGTINQALSVSPDGHWVATGRGHVAIRPLRQRAPLVLAGHTGVIEGVVFAPDGSWVAAASSSGSSVRLWPLTGDPPAPSRQLVGRNDQLGFLYTLDVSPDGQTLLVGSETGKVTLIPLAGALRPLAGFTTQAYGVAFSHDGRLAAAGGSYLQEPVVRVWEVVSGKEVALLDSGVKEPINGVASLPDGSLVAAGDSGFRVWDVAAGTSRLLWTPEKISQGFGLGATRSSAAGKLPFVYDGVACILDSATGALQRLPNHGTGVVSVALDPTGTIIATCGGDGIVRIGPATGEPPHLLLGHDGDAIVAISPKGDWVVSGGVDASVRLWPVPDLTKPPAHTLPLPELLAKLRAQTNVRVVADAGAPGGYRTEVGPFPGWAEVPEWQP
jgi:WD40 repeat protein